MGNSLSIYLMAINIQTSVTRLSQLHRRDYLSRFQAAFDGVHRIAIAFLQVLAPSETTANGRHFRCECAVLVLEIVNLEFVIRFHGFTVASSNQKASPDTAELLDRQHPLHAAVPEEFPNATEVGGAQSTDGEGGEHASSSRWI